MTLTQLDRVVLALDQLELLRDHPDITDDEHDYITSIHSILEELFDNIMSSEDESEEDE